MPHLLCHCHTSRLIFLRYALTEVSILEGSVRDALPSITITLNVSEAGRFRKPQNQWKFLQECQAALSGLVTINSLVGYCIVI